MGPNADKRTGFELMAALEQTSEEHSISDKNIKIKVAGPVTSDLSQLSPTCTPHDATVTPPFAVTPPVDSTHAVPLPLSTRIFTLLYSDVLQPCVRQNMSFL